jgi:hypothetical protein
MVDKETSITAAVNSVRQQIQLLGGLSGAVNISSDSVAPDGSEIVNVRGAALDSIISGGIQYTLTKDNMLVIATGNNLLPYLNTFQDGINPAFQQVAAIPGQADRFFYMYVDPSQKLNNKMNLTALAGGQIRRSAFYLNLIFRAK